MRGHTAKRQAEAHFMSDGPSSVKTKKSSFDHDGGAGAAKGEVPNARAPISSGALSIDRVTI
jgi:hypothetical protein